MKTIRIARLQPESLLPTRKHPADAGLDLYALAAAEVPAHGMRVIPTGISLEIPPGYVGLIKPKGRNDHLLGAGVVDAGYQGEIVVKVVNPSGQPLFFAAGAAIGQLLVLPVETPAVIEVGVEEIHSTPSARGGSGGIHAGSEPV